MRKVLLLALPRADHEEVGAHPTPKFFISLSNGHILTPPDIYSHTVILTRIRYVLQMRHTLEHIDIYHQDGSTHTSEIFQCVVLLETVSTVRNTQMNIAAAALYTTPMADFPLLADHTSLLLWTIHCQVIQLRIESTNRHISLGYNLPTRKAINQTVGKLNSESFIVSPSTCTPMPLIHIPFDNVGVQNGTLQHVK